MAKHGNGCGGHNPAWLDPDTVHTESRSESTTRRSGAEPIEPEDTEDGDRAVRKANVASLSADGVPPSSVPYNDPKTEIDETDAEPPAVNSKAPEENFYGTSGNPDGSLDKPDAPVSSPEQLEQ